MYKFRFTPKIVFLIALWSTIISAQGICQRHQIGLGVGLGAGVGTMSVTDQSKSDLGINLQGRLVIDRMVFMTEVNPLEVRNPVMDESFRATNILLSVDIGKNLKLRPGAGIQYRFWSGKEKVENSDFGILFTIDIGYEIKKTSTFSILPELVARWSLIEIEGGVASRFIGLQIVGLWK